MALSLACPGVASAKWFKAETERFIVYGEGRESIVRDYAIKLTTFDATLRFFHPMPARPATQKVEVYLATRSGAFRTVLPKAAPDALGFYAATTDGVIAVVGTAGQAMGGDDVMFHEYAHHFMLENFPAAYPAWFVEGWAEYFMTTEVSPKIVKVGGYNTNRIYWLFASPWLPMEEVLSKRFGEIRKDRRDMYYPQAWLFMHYMRSDTTRAQQLDQAVREVATGGEPVAAFEKAMGMNAQALTAVLRKYQKLKVYTLPNPLKEPPVVTVSMLPESADDLLLQRVRMDLSSSSELDSAFLAEVRRRASNHPGDRFAELVLARAEFAVGDVAAGEAIIKRRLEADPKDIEALRLAGRGQIAAGDRAPETQDARYRAARPYLVKAYQLDENDYQTLHAYIVSRTVEPEFPNDNDMSALLLARALAPSVQPISFLAGQALLTKGRKREAMILLGPLANNPHGGRLAAEARALMAGKTTEQAQVEGDRIEREGDEDAVPQGPVQPPAQPKQDTPVSP